MAFDIRDQVASWAKADVTVNEDGTGKIRVSGFAEYEGQTVLKYVDVDLPEDVKALVMAVLEEHKNKVMTEAHFGLAKQL